MVKYEVEDSKGYSILLEDYCFRALFIETPAAAVCRYNNSTNNCYENEVSADVKALRNTFKAMRDGGNIAVIRFHVERGQNEVQEVYNNVPWIREAGKLIDQGNGLIVYEIETQGKPWDQIFNCLSSVRNISTEHNNSYAKHRTDYEPYDAFFMTMFVQRCKSWDNEIEQYAISGWNDYMWGNCDLISTKSARILYEKGPTWRLTTPVLTREVLCETPECSGYTRENGLYYENHEDTCFDDDDDDEYYEDDSDIPHKYYMFYSFEGDTKNEDSLERFCNSQLVDFLRGLLQGK